MSKVLLERADARKLSFPRNFFDSVICNMLLHHMKKAIQTIREMVRVVKPGGGQ